MSPVRIDGNQRATGVAARGGAARAGAGGGSFALESTATPERSSGPAALTPATSLDALLALQSVEDPLLKKRKLVRRGRALLDALDGVRTDLLAGMVGEGRLNQLLALIGQAREQAEPGLDALIDDIELRARVELAKRGHFLSA